MPACTAYWQPPQLGLSLTTACCTLCISVLRICMTGYCQQRHRQEAAKYHDFGADAASKNGQVYGPEVGPATRHKDSNARQPVRRGLGQDQIRLAAQSPCLGCPHRQCASGLQINSTYALYILTTTSRALGLIPTRPGTALDRAAMLHGAARHDLARILLPP